MPDITPEQREKLTELNKQLAKVANNSGQGRMHGFWDIVDDIRAFLDGKSPILKYNADEWIAFAEKKLGRGGGDA